MTNIENIYVCLGAPLLVAIVCIKGDGRRNLMFLLAGMSSCLLSGYISSYAASVAGVDLLTASHEIAPAVEEMMKALPMLFFLLIFDPEKKSVISGALRIAIGFATFENVCFLASNDTTNLLHLVIRGFGTGAMHVTCGIIVSAGWFFLWDRIWLRTVGAFAMLCFVTVFHAIFNVFVNQTGVVFWIGCAIPLTVVMIYLAFFRRKTELT